MGIFWAVCSVVKSVIRASSKLARNRLTQLQLSLFAERVDLVKGYNSGKYELAQNYL